MIRIIEQLIQSRGITPYRMCKDIKIPQQTYYNWAHGISKPSVNSLKKIAEYFGVTISYITGDDATLEPLDPPQDQRRIPILGRVPAGVPIAAITDIEDYIYYQPPRPTSAEFVALRVVGHSMEPTIPDGSIVVIRVCECCDPGDICAVSINGEDATCKVVKPDRDGGVFLMPINPSFEPLHYSAQEIRDLPVRIIGAVVEVRYVPRIR